MLSSPYTDQITFLNDRSWLVVYSLKSGGLDVAANVALLNCMEDREPVLVVRQQTDKNSRSGSTYLIAGLGQIERYDAQQDVFRLRGLHMEEVIRYLYGEGKLADGLVETAVRLEALEDWTAVVQEERAVYRVNRLTRDAAFRDVVLANYGYTCAVTGLRFRRGAYVEAEAAHIIGKEARGPDDPRNGLALSRTAHWAFDHGIFTLSDHYEGPSMTVPATATNAWRRSLKRKASKSSCPTRAFTDRIPRLWPGTETNGSGRFCAAESTLKRQSL
jgi:putative restriction endonuclease